MKTRLSRLLLVILAACTFYVKSYAQAPQFDVVSTNSPDVRIYEKFELSMRITANYTNPYDYKQIRVWCTFRSPSGLMYEVDGFYMDDYVLDVYFEPQFWSSGFRVRFAPNEVGKWAFTLNCTTPEGTTSRRTDTLVCLAGNGAGYIRKNPSNYLSFDNGTQYIPVGQNMGWDIGRVLYNYITWVDSLAKNKGNFIRLWMADWSLGFEWKNGSNGFSGLARYKQRSAYLLDWILEYCGRKGVNIMLCLNHHGQVSTQVNPEWADNPYNRANGGPCLNTWDFFSNDSAKNLLKNRLRYIVARYGYYPNLVSWELFNEVEWTDEFNTYRDSVTKWHDEMSKYIRSIDNYKHLITTSYAHDNEDADTWNLSSIDFTQTHYYVNTPNLETVVHAGQVDYLSRFGKPTLNGEFGLGPAGAQLSTMDPNGTHFHNTLWATAFSGSMGSAMSWWWDDYIEPQNLYRHYKPLSELLSTLPLKNARFRPGMVSTSGGGTADITISPGAGWSAPTASTITITGNSTNPGPTQIGTFLYGSQWNTQFRNPPSFAVNYTVAGQFRVVTGTTTGTAPKVSIYLDGNLQLNQDAASNSTYSINVPAGNHLIKVDNPGTDWINISSYVFTNIGLPLNAYIIHSADSTMIAGWIQNKQYNWKFLRDNPGLPPNPVSGAQVSIPALPNASYRVIFFNCTTGAPVDTIVGTATGNTLSLPVPPVSWDLAMVATMMSITSIPDLPMAKQLKIFPNPVRERSVMVEYELVKPSAVEIELYDLVGQRLQTFFIGNQPPGLQQKRYYMSSFTANGLYLLKIKIGKDSYVQKLVFEN